MGQDIKVITNFFKTMQASNSLSADLASERNNFKDVLMNNSISSSKQKEDSAGKRDVKVTYLSQKKDIYNHNQKTAHNTADTNNSTTTIKRDNILGEQKIAIKGEQNSETIVIDGNLIKTEEAIVQKVMDTLDITKEQLESIMTLLGLTPIDLLDKGNLKQLILQVDGTADIIKFVTDTNMVDTMNNLHTNIVNIYNESNNVDNSLQNFVQSSEEPIMEGNQSDNVIIGNSNEEANVQVVDVESSQNVEVVITKEDIQKAVNDIEQSDNSKVVVNIKDESVESEPQNDLSNTYDKANNEMNNNTNISVSNSSENEMLIKTHYENTSEIDQTKAVKDLNLEAEVAETVKITKEGVSEEVQINDTEVTVETKQLTETKDKDDSSNFNNDKKDNNQQPKEESNIKLDNTVETLIRNITEQVDDNSELQVREFREVVNQIVEQIKVTIRPGVSSMDIQLNPESLGRINLQVLSKEGVLTAQFTAQNQVAKEAIESQMMVLKENLNNQGLKVEAIEVTVANFGFDQNKEADSHNQGSKQSRRKINLDDINSLLLNDELTGEEKLAADIMRQNGSTVDYTA